MNKRLLIKKANDSPLWILELRTSKQNILLVELVSQGISYNDEKWKKITYKRNIYRKVLLEKLKMWENGELKEESNPNYSDYIKTINYNKFGEEIKDE